MATHDPTKFASGVSAKLAAKSRHVCVFLGAGTSRACGLPDVVLLKTLVLARLSAEDRAALIAVSKERNLEQTLSRLRRISALLEGDQQLDGLTAQGAVELDAKVCHAIVQELDITGKDRGPVDAFAAWAARATYRVPVELFTVNYDLLLESALENRRVPYFDGFVGALEAPFHTDLVEGSQELDRSLVPAFFVRLWKLHGSVNWAWDKKRVFRMGQPVTSGLPAAIYPSDEKYDESRRIPFLVIQNRFRRALNQAETLVLIVGYSFGDAHLNEFIFDAASRRERSEFIVFCYSEIPALLAERAMTTPNLQVVHGTEAIIGGVRAGWKTPEDAPAELWNTADARFALCDFRNLAAYLSRSTDQHADMNVSVAVRADVETRPNPSGSGGANG